MQLFYPRESRREARSACSASSNERSADRSRQTPRGTRLPCAAQVLTAHEVGGVNVRSSVHCPRAQHPVVPERRRFLAAASPRRSAIDLGKTPFILLFPRSYRDEKFNQKRGISDATRVIKRINGAEITREVLCAFSVPSIVCRMRAEWSLNLHLCFGVRMASGLVSLVQRA